MDLPELDAVAPSALRSGPDVRGDAVDTDCSGDERRCTGLPKTRSGKILRGTMQKIANVEEHKVPATIDDPGVLPEIAEALKGIGYAGG